MHPARNSMSIGEGTFLSRNRIETDDESEKLGSTGQGGDEDSLIGDSLLSLSPLNESDEEGD